MKISLSYLNWSQRRLKWSSLCSFLLTAAAVAVFVFFPKYTVESDGSDLLQVPAVLSGMNCDADLGGKGIIYLRSSLSTEWLPLQDRQDCDNTQQLYGFLNKENQLIFFIENKVGDFLIHGVRTSATNKKLLWPENNIIVMNKWNSLPLVLAFVFFVCGVMFWRAYAQRNEF
ncbi:hypothetical protein [Rheinheimera mangrovi]|uniref:hypothetical protein n=1 Tax=Rheinheimera mangrovi TaxID=2498451 RepID=UPI000F8EE198|nr:hypothetical protein [Rheinheimera mangrovi]